MNCNVRFFNVDLSFSNITLMSINNLTKNRPFFTRVNINGHFAFSGK